MEEENKKEKKKIKIEQGQVDVPPEKVSDEIKTEMEHGEKDEDIYTKEGQEKQEEDAEIEPWEEGFMQGAADDGQLGNDALTGESLMGVEDVFEIEIDGQIYRFVNEENAQKFREKKEKEKQV